eukprot:XP_011671640.1 PREDICTED: pollen-specific leucine-rich repeat extensin-like protein 1 [Strongylocentrotus purpuratus]
MAEAATLFTNGGNMKKLKAKRQQVLQCAPPVVEPTPAVHANHVHANHIQTPPQAPAVQPPPAILTPLDFQPPLAFQPTPAVHANHVHANHIHVNHIQTPPQAPTVQPPPAIQTPLAFQPPPADRPFTPPPPADFMCTAPECAAREEELTVLRQQYCFLVEDYNALQVKHQRVTAKRGEPGC